MLRENPSQNRVEYVAKAIFGKLNDLKQKEWVSVPDNERSFWTDIAQAAVAASDDQIAGEVRKLWPA